MRKMMEVFFSCLVCQTPEKTQSPKPQVFDLQFRLFSDMPITYIHGLAKVILGINYCPRIEIPCHQIGVIA